MDAILTVNSHRVRPSGMDCAQRVNLGRHFPHCEKLLDVEAVLGENGQESLPFQDTVLNGPEFRHDRGSVLFGIALKRRNDFKAQTRYDQNRQGQ